MSRQQLHHLGRPPTYVPLADAIDNLKVGELHRWPAKDMPCRTWFFNRAQLNNIVLRVLRAGNEGLIVRLK